MASRAGPLLFLSAVVCLLRLSNCQDLQCSTLNTGYSGEPIAGGDLTICSTLRSDLQCCTQDYINTVTTIANDKLREELRVQLRNTAATFNDTVALIYSYFSNEFVTGFLQVISDAIRIGTTNIDLMSLRRVIGDDVDLIPANLVINDNTRDFNITGVIVNITMSLGDALALQLGVDNRRTYTCLLNAILNNINDMDVAVIIRSIEELRRSFTLLNRIVDYLQDFPVEFRFPQNCVRRFVELNFCARCTGRAPPLCSNTCGALVRGCLSAHYSALSQQFDILWNVSRQVLNATNNTLHTLFAEERLLIDAGQAALDVAQCTQGTGGDNPRGKRQAGEDTPPPFIPAARMQELARLAGRAFTYDDGSGNRGPVVCRPSGDERNFCVNGGSRARVQNCNSSDPCTSSCLCFNGRSEQRENTEEFDMDGIEGQDNNPAIDLNITELVEIARSIGTPASSFLEQEEVDSLIPEGVEVPPGEPYTIGGERKSSQAMVSLMMVTVVAIAVFVFN